MSSKRALRIPIDGSGNQIGKPQESPKLPSLKLEIKTNISGISTDQQMSITPKHSLHDINEFLPATSFKGLANLADKILGTAEPIAEQPKLLGRRQANSVHGSEGTADTTISMPSEPSAHAIGGSSGSNAMSAKQTTDADEQPNPKQQSAPLANGSGSECSSANSLIDNEEEDVSLLIDLGQFPEFSAILTSTYWGPMTQNSTTLDIIAVYLKGQKMLYIDSKTHCENSLNILMMPTILISAICTVLSVAMKSLESGAILVSCLTGASTFILSVISFLKLDAKAQAHKTSAYQFDKLQTMCEFFSGKVLLIKDKDNEMSTNVQKFVNEVEKKVEEIKDTNQFIIPEAIRFRYSYIYSTNVFSQIKKMKAAEKVLKNRLYFLVKEMDKLPPNTLEEIHVEYRKARNQLLEDIVEHHNNLFIVDKNFNEEINKYGNGQKAKVCYNLWNWFKV